MPAPAVATEKLVLRAERSEGIVERARPSGAVEEPEFEEVAHSEVGKRAETLRRERGIVNVYNMWSGQQVSF